MYVQSCLSLYKWTIRHPFRQCAVVSQKRFPHHKHSTLTSFPTANHPQDLLTQKMQLQLSHSSKMELNYKQSPAPLYWCIVIKAPNNGQHISIYSSARRMWCPYPSPPDTISWFQKHACSATGLTGAQQMYMWRHNFKGKLRASSSFFSGYFYSLTMIIIP